LDLFSRITVVSGDCKVKKFKKNTVRKWFGLKA
jgi:hypothetical protein